MMIHITNQFMLDFGLNTQKVTQTQAGERGREPISFQEVKTYPSGERISLWQHLREFPGDSASLASRDGLSLMLPQDDRVVNGVTPPPANQLATQQVWHAATRQREGEEKESQRERDKERDNEREKRVTKSDKEDERDK